MVLDYLGEILAATVGLLGLVVTATGVLCGNLLSRISHLVARVNKLEDEQKEMWRLREQDAITKRRMGDFIDELERHINDGKGPPPPARPESI